MRLAYTLDPELFPDFDYRQDELEDFVYGTLVIGPDYPVIVITVGTERNTDDSFGAKHIVYIGMRDGLMVRDDSADAATFDNDNLSGWNSETQEWDGYPMDHELHRFIRAAHEEAVSAYTGQSYCYNQG